MNDWLMTGERGISVSSPKEWKTSEMRSEDGFILEKER